MSTDPAREAAARAAVELIKPGMTLGLGSGRAVWRAIELIGKRKWRRPQVQAAFASERTAELGRAAGIEEVELDGELRLDLAIDGADEIDAELGLIKGGGGALLREKLVILAAERFVVVAEESKWVPRLGRTFPLPVEVVRFGWRDTRRRVFDLMQSADLRTDDAGAPVVTDEGHYLLDCRIGVDAEPPALGAALKATTGVVEHGFFLGMAHQVVLGRPDGSYAVITRPP